ncbi:CYTH domain-containing protein [Oscillatoriales cyanobacterium LEGE 11467]|uniref:CYTH domain-containing protein n=1 Tax=Zarconia navalis LEGE 11467 TaxID=1828826 RepID=A0A928Z744_9CYAN|nr:CYTH domain-containing protein [Zarconia navalis]MBE9039293.1 CYTH domain-containing protein [Zarconia navalis LEGE 11467]
MAVEIERKFLVVGNQWRSLAAGVDYAQGYIASGTGKTVRVRIAGDKGYLTIKGATVGLARMEFEYPIPVADAREMLDRLCNEPPIEKVRYKIPIGDLVWEVDEFTGVNQGLIVAEVELTHERQEIQLPDWIGAEVSHDARYYNANLAKFPYSSWSES